MKVHFTTVTRKGQITIPADIRRELGLHEGDRVAVMMHDGVVRLERARSVVRGTAGVLGRGTPPLTTEELRETAERVIAQDAIERMESCR